MDYKTMIIDRVIAELGTQHWDYNKRVKLIEEYFLADFPNYASSQQMLFAKICDINDLYPSRKPKTN